MKTGFVLLAAALSISSFAQAAVSKGHAAPASRTVAANPEGAAPGECPLAKATAGSNFTNSVQKRILPPMAGEARASAPVQGSKATR